MLASTFYTPQDGLAGIVTALALLAITHLGSCCSPTTEPTIQELFDFSTAVVSARVTDTFGEYRSSDHVIRPLPQGMYSTQVKVFCQYKGEQTMNSREFNISMAGFNHGRCTEVNLVKGGSYIMWLLQVGDTWQHVSATPLKLTTSNMGKMKRICGANIRRINVFKKSPMYRQCRPPSKKIKGCRNKPAPRYAVAKVSESRSSGTFLAPLHFVFSLVAMTCSSIFM